MNKFILYFCLLFSFFVSAEENRVGSSNFMLPGGVGRVEKEISVYVHVPKTWRKDSPVVLVIPGAGRNAWSYRDAWVEESEKRGVIVVSPSYSEDFYPRFWNYNIARMISDVEINKSKTDFESFSISENPSDWIFNDFDRIFEVVKSKFGLTAEKYDVFGHSAGGQILHRFAIFFESQRVSRILASNSGWYTVPSFEAKFPAGLINAPITEEELKVAFSRKLIVFLGELDNENETRGHLVKNQRVNVQGLHRLERGNFFYSSAEKEAKSRGVDFNWEKVIVPNVGHDYKKMSVEAAEYLYPL